MRKLILAALVACPIPAMAGTTVTALPAYVPIIENHDDLFDVAQGTVFVGSTGQESGFVFEDAFGAVSPNSPEPGHLVFSQYGNLQFLTIGTPAPVTISGFNLFLQGDGAGPRELASIEFLGSLDSVNYTSITSFTFGGPTYLDAYGSPTIQVQSTFSAVTYRYFQLNTIDRISNNGGRILEFDAISGSIGPGGVPEPATWAMMLVGFGLMGGAMRSAKRREKATVSYA